jgi:hypothetical protein
MFRILILCLLLIGCGLVEPPVRVDTTFTLPMEQQMRVTAPGGATTLDVDAIAPGGRNNLFIRGTSGAWISLRGVPFALSDTMLFFVSRALPAEAGSWFKSVPTWFYISTVGGVVLMPGTNYGEVGVPRWDAGIGCCIAQHGAGALGDSLSGAPGRWGFGGGGDPLRAAQDGMIRVRFYSR